MEKTKKLRNALKTLQTVDSEVINELAKAIDLVASKQDRDNDINSIIESISNAIRILDDENFILYFDITFITMISKLNAFRYLLNVRKSRLFNVEERLTDMFIEYQELIGSLIGSINTTVTN